MDITMLFLFCLISLVLGAGIMLLVQYYIFFKFCRLPDETDEQRDINIQYSLPKDMQKTARLLNATPTVAGVTCDDANAPKVAINFVMQFLFHELKHSNRVRKWLYRKLSLELDELIAKTTTGRLFDKLTITELDLGVQFPEIKSLHVHNVELDNKEGRIESLDLLLNLHYKGNFRTSIDADMVLGKKGSLTLKVKHLSGLARLQFTRKPYTHWSLSFLGDPELDLAIESKYQGRQMQSNIASLISNQIRKAVRRKHTLPNYKLRYKPFFHKTLDEEIGESDIQPNGLLEVKVSELSRLVCPPHIVDIYCTLTVASFAFVEMRQKDDRNVVVSLDVEIHKAKNQQIGIVFKQLADHVEIEAILPNTPACKSNMKSGDVLIAVDGKHVSSIQQVGKIVRSLQMGGISLRVERVVPGIIRNDAILEDLELYEDLGGQNAAYGVTRNVMASESVENPKQQTPMGRSISNERRTSSESSMGSTPTNSPKKSRFIAKALKKTINRDAGDHLKEPIIEEALSKGKISATSIQEERSKQPIPSTTAEGINDVEHYYQHSTIDSSVSNLIYMEDLSQFKLDAKSKFLNVCVYGKRLENSVLLGFINISIPAVLIECSETSISQCLKKFDLNPPIAQDLKTHPLSQQSGFNPNLCFGDVLFAFSWDGNPNLSQTGEILLRQTSRTKIRSASISEKSEEGGNFASADNISLKSACSNDSIMSSASSIPHAHNFIRTHFQRATQCDFCGKKIWLKDAVQCRDCSMCCHKKCINRCQNSTVCGPVDCSSSSTGLSNMAATPEFTVTEAEHVESGKIGGDGVPCDGTTEGEEALAAFDIYDDASIKNVCTTPSSEVHRTSLTGLLAQGIKRVNSVNNLTIPSIANSFSSSNVKSLPPTPQHSPSRRQSLIVTNACPFETITQRLESISADLTNSTLSDDHVVAITEPILNLPKSEDVMIQAKVAGKALYADFDAKLRVEKINELLSILRLTLDDKASVQNSLIRTQDSGSSGELSSEHQEFALMRSEERMQALSVIMLYLCTGLQHAQGVATQ